MAREGVAQRHAAGNKAVAKGTRVTRLVAAVTEAGGQVPTTEYVAVTSPAEESALRLLHRAGAAAESVGKAATLFVGRPGAEALVEALRWQAAFFEVLRTEAAEFIATTRGTASTLPVAEEVPKSQETRPGEEGEGMAPVVEGSGRRESRKTKRNGRYFGPEWSAPNWSVVCDLEPAG